MAVMSGNCPGNQRRRKRFACATNHGAAAAIVLLLHLFASAKCFAFTTRSFSTSKTTTGSTISLLYSRKSRTATSEATEQMSSFCFPDKPPYLAVITEPDACDNPKRVNETLTALSSAVSTNKVALISVRVVQPTNVPRDEFEQRVVNLTRQLVVMSSKHSFQVAVTSDWIDAAVQSCAHGIHVKERHRSLIPEIRLQFAPRVALIGTSAHSVSSALKANSEYQPDYLFVGTCYPTESHPEKVKLEGPALPGQVCRALEQQQQQQQLDRPVVFAIGGIDEETCAEPVLDYGADGVAAIRSVLRSSNPGMTVETIHQNMQSK
jgi:thiamine-phosphate diphosphorylase